MALGLAIAAGALGAGALAKGIGGAVQAKNQRGALGRHEKALRKQAKSVPRGGIPQSVQETGAARAQLALQDSMKSARAEAARGGGNTNADANREQQSAAMNALAGYRAQQDTASAQVAQQNDAARRALRAQADQVGAQKAAMKNAPLAAALGAVGGAADGAVQLTAPAVKQELGGIAYQQKLRQQLDEAVLSGSLPPEYADAIGEWHS